MPNATPAFMVHSDLWLAERERERENCIRLQYASCKGINERGFNSQLNEKMQKCLGLKFGVSSNQSDLIMPRMTCI